MTDNNPRPTKSKLTASAKLITFGLSKIRFMTIEAWVERPNTASGRAHPIQPNFDAVGHLYWSPRLQRVFFILCSMGARC